MPKTARAAKSATGPHDAITGEIMPFEPMDSVTVIAHQNVRLGAA